MVADLKGKVALVTGGSRGIGRTIAQRLAADGALVAVHYGNSEAAAIETVSLIEAQGGSAFAIGADLSKPGAAVKLFGALDEELKARTGSNTFDILINNAGIAPFIGFADTTEAVLDEIYTVNFKSLFFVTQEAAKRLRDGGRVVSMSTIAARVPVGAVAAYSALKAPIDNLTKTLAVEFGPRSITVNAVAPGVIDTDMAAAFSRSPEGQEFAKSKQALKRIGQPEDVADVVGFLVSLDGRWVTGQVIEVGGGSALTF